MTDTILQSADGFSSPHVSQTAGASAPALYSNRGNLTSNRDTPVAMEPAGGRPTSPAGLLFIASAFFATLALICLSGPVPEMELPDRGRVAMGWVYLGMAGVFCLARISVPMWKRLESAVIAWAKHRQWSKGELRRLVAQLEGTG